MAPIKRPLDETSQCYWCTEYMVPPIRRCLWCGKELCGSCGPTYVICPNCHGQEMWSNNEAKEEWLLNSKFLCRYECCSYLSSSPQVRQHEKVCPFLFLACPFFLRNKALCGTRSNWVGQSKAELIDHLITKHEGRMTRKNHHKFELKNYHTVMHCGTIWYTYFVFVCFDIVFQLSMTFDFPKRQIFFTVCYNSDVEYKHKFKFQLQVCNTKGVLTNQRPCSWIRDQEYYDVRKMQVPMKFLGDFCKNDSIFFYIQILHA